MAFRFPLVLGLACLVTSGCAAFGAQQGEPLLPSTALPSDYAWPPTTLPTTTLPTKGSGARPASVRAKSAWSASPPLGALEPQTRPRGTEPPGLAEPMLPPPAQGGCLSLLEQAGVRYVLPGPQRGVVTPVHVTGGLGGIRYTANAGLPLIVDCRFAVTLLRVAPVLRELGVSELRYSGAYVYRMSSKGRLSLHANGLAIDIHEVTIAGERLSVKRSFAKGLGGGCESNLPPLNRIACELKRTGVFRELLTPDYDANHHDHLHLGISPGVNEI